MRVLVVTGTVFALVGVPWLGLSGASPPGGEPEQVVVNSQESLADAVGKGFRDEAWEYPEGLLPEEFPGLDHVSGPGDEGLSPKARWRKPVVLKDEESGVRLNINCYRRRDEKGGGGGQGTPFLPLLEPDYLYKKAEFHGLRAARASKGGRIVSAFREGELLFKVEATGGKAKARRKAVGAAAAAIWKFRRAE